MKIEKGCSNIYNGILKNNNKYADVNDKALFNFKEGATVIFKSSIPNQSCKVEMFDLEENIDHYSATITNNMFAASSRKEISPLRIKATNSLGRILLDINLIEWAKKIS